MNQQVLAEAMGNLPDVELEFVKQYDPEGKSSDNELRRGLALIRLLNPCCNYCQQKTDIGKLQLCVCKLVWYCNDKDCKSQDAAVHDAWCCKKDAKERDMGPMRIMTIPMKKQNP